MTFLLLLAVLGLLACTPQAPTPTTTPVATETRANPSARSPDSVPPTLDVPPRIQADLAARGQASMRAARVTVGLDTLRLAVGDQVPIPSLPIEARDSAGNVIPNFGPSFRIEDPRVAALNGLFITGVATGTTVLVIGAPTEDPQAKRRWMRDLARLVVIVRLPEQRTPRGGA